METSTRKSTYYEDENVKLEIEKVQHNIHLHVSVTNWSPSIAKHSYSVLHTLFEDMKESGYKDAWTITPNPKFASVFGATSIRKFKYENKEYEVMKWDLK